MAIHALVTPALTAIGFRSDGGLQGLPVSTTWQQRALDRFHAAQQLERLLAVVLAGATLEGGDGALGPRILGSMERLRSIGDR
jgi:hypothetical protein